MRINSTGDTGAYERTIESLLSQREQLNDSLPSYELAYETLTNIIEYLQAFISQDAISNG